MIAVETYEVEEIKSEIGNLAADAEAIELAQKLGLKGQLELSNPETLTRNPYREMSQLEGLVFRTLFPTETPIENYSSGIIPLRVLQVAAHAKECGLFHHLEIWHPADHREKDPVLVGHTTANAWDRGHKCCLLARWGDPLCSFEQLAEKAKAKWKAVAKQELLTGQAKIEQALKTLDSKADAIFQTGERASVSISVW